MRSQYSKRGFKSLKQYAKENNISFASEEVTFFSNSPYAGVTIAFRKSIPSEDCVTLDVAVSYCATADKYKHKIGKFEAITNLLSGEFVRLPLGQELNRVGATNMKDTLLNYFSV